MITVVPRLKKFRHGHCVQILCHAPCTPGKQHPCAHCTEHCVSNADEQRPHAESPALFACKAEKYVVPYANADIHGPTVRPPRKKSFSVDVLRMPQMPTHIMTARKRRRRMRLDIEISFLHVIPSGKERRAASGQKIADSYYTSLLLFTPLKKIPL